MSAPTHVLVVDDEEDLCVLIGMRLEHHGYAVTTEGTARGALELLTRELFDVVILDLRLEDADGMQVLQRIRELDSDLPVVILTAHGSIEAAVEATQLGAYGFLTKPFHDHELLQTLEHAQEGLQLRRQLARFRRMVGETAEGDCLTGTSDAIQQVRSLIARIAPSEVSVLVTGESGTGKELAARSVHALSPRRGRRFVALNCAALPPELLESELFGHVRGAFTSAHRDKKGLLEVAEGGTLFLDEVADAPLSVQAKLLRVLQERRYTPLGATSERDCDVRIVAATNRDLEEAVTAGRFREDLYFRLHVVPVRMPALRERREDIPPLADLFLNRAAQRDGVGRARLDADAVRLLCRHPWPGNVRELANMMTGAALLAHDGRVGPKEIAAVLPELRADAAVEPPPAPDAPPTDDVVRDASRAMTGSSALPSMRDAREAFDRAYLEECLRRCRGNVTAAARLSGRNRTDFHDLLRRHDIDANAYRE